MNSNLHCKNLHYCIFHRVESRTDDFIRISSSSDYLFRFVEKELQESNMTHVLSWFDFSIYDRIEEEAWQLQ